jgi:hypothetical protein
MTQPELFPVYSLGLASREVRLVTQLLAEHDINVRDDENSSHGVVFCRTVSRLSFFISWS